MAKGKSTWKYNKLLTARKRYYHNGSTLVRGPVPTIDGSLDGIKRPDSTLSLSDFKPTGPTNSTGGGSFLGLDWSNPFKGDGGKEAMGALLGAATKAVGSIGGGLLSGGMTSGAGNVLSGLGSIASAIPGPWGSVASLGTGLLGGLANRMFGSKMNTENIAKVESNINNLKSFQSNASDFDTLSSNWANADVGMTFNDSYIGKDGWFSDKAKNKAADLRNQIETGTAWIQNTLTNNAENISATQIQNLLGNHAAFGGELNTQGGDFTNGLLYIDNGGSHETNPYEGVQLGVDQEGTPNLVEEGETVFKDYVFSRRMKVPGAIRKKYKLGGTKGISFAEASKRLAKESEERPNDPISARGLEAIMRDLAQAQEASRVANNTGTQYAHGGQMGNYFEGDGYLPNIINYKWAKGYNGGWFEDGTTNYKDSYLRNLAAMQHSDIDRALNSQYTYYMDPANKGTKRWNAIDEFYSKNPEFRIPDVTGKLSNAHYENITALGRDGKPGWAHMLFENATPAKRDIRYFRRNADGTATQMLGEDKPGGLILPWEGANEAGFTFLNRPGNTYREAARIERPYDPESNVINTDVYFDEITPVPEVEDKPSEDAPSLTMEDLGGKSWEGWRYAPMIGQGMFAITDALGWTNKPDYSNADAILEASKSAGEVQPVRFNPIGNYLTYKPFDRDYYINKMNAEAGASRRAVMDTSGGNRATAMAGILAADNNYLNQIGGLARQAEEYNLAQRQQVEEFNRGTNTTNSQGMLQADIANQEARLKAKDFTLKGSMAAADIREKARLASDAAKQANLAGLFQSIGGIGEENKNMNMLKFLIASGTITAKPELLSYLGIKVKSKDDNTTKANGGRIKRKRGLTI